MSFDAEVKEFLQKENIDFTEKNELLRSSDFPLLFVSSHPICIHCISITPGSKNNSEHYFSQLSDEANEKKIRLIHLWEDVWKHHEELVRSRILALFGRSKRIHGRQTEIVRLNKKVADDFLIENHLHGTTNAYYKFGLTLNDELVAVATFSKSRVMNDSQALYRSYELVRFASLKGTTITGGLSKLLNYFINEFHPAHIMTYADRDWSSGESYTKLGFTFSGNTKPQEFFIHPGEMIRLYPHRLKETEDLLLKKGYLKIYNAGNAKFILDRRR